MTAVAVAALVAVAGVLWGREHASPRVLRPPARGPAGAPGKAGGPPRRRWRYSSRGRRGDRRKFDRVEAEALDLLDGLAPALRAGLPPAAALGLVSAGASRFPPAEARVTDARSGGGAAPPGLGEAAARGEPLAPVWWAHAEAAASDDLRLVAAAWAMCETLGSPLAPTVATVADVIRRRRAVRQRITAALAGPRATMRVLTALPLSGPVVALAVGVPPGDLYTQPAGALALGAGLSLLAVGRLWSARMIRAVTVEPSRRPRPWRRQQ